MSVVGLAGTIGAGKGTVVAYLKGQGYKHYSSSAVLRAILRERGLPETRTYMSPLANELMEKYEGGVLHVSHERAEQDGAQDYVLEAIHRESEAAYIRSLGGVIIGIDADLPTRYTRSRARGEGEKDDVSFDEFVEHAKREDEGEGNTGPNIRAVLNSADFILTNNGSIEELHHQIDEVLAKLNKA